MPLGYCFPGTCTHNPVIAGIIPVMQKPVNIHLPAGREELAELRAGDAVRLYGTIYTMRDAGHQRCLAALKEEGVLPFGLAGQALFYAGPTPARSGRPFGAIGPTTASRMDKATPALLEAGITLTLGKGRRSNEVAKACAATGSIYLIAVGGAAAYLGGFVEESELIAWEDLGTEALRRLTLNGLPAFVGIDSQGRQNGDVSIMSSEDKIETPPFCLPHPPVISFEGGEGVGKSTQIRLLADRLTQAGYEVCCTRDPGNTGIGEQVRAILLDRSNTALAPLAELLLYEAARAQLVEEVIRPALDAGKVVLVDRFTDSTLAYQAYARCLDRKLVDAANAIGSGGLVPTRTILLDQDMEAGLERATKNGADRMEAEGQSFHWRVHEGFEQLAREFPERIVTVKCQERKEDTHELIFAAVSDLFSKQAAEPYVVTTELLQKIKDDK